VLARHLPHLLLRLRLQCTNQTLPHLLSVLRTEPGSRSTVELRTERNNFIVTYCLFYAPPLSHLLAAVDTVRGTFPDLWPVLRTGRKRLSVTCWLFNAQYEPALLHLLCVWRTVRNNFCLLDSCLPVSESVLWQATLTQCCLWRDVYLWLTASFNSPWENLLRFVRKTSGNTCAHMNCFSHLYHFAEGCQWKTEEPQKSKISFICSS